MKKILFKALCIIALITLLLSFSISVSASEKVEENTYQIPELYDTGAEVSPFEELYSLIANNADKLLSALAFIVSLILAFAYRRGLIPLVKSALSSLGGSVGKFEKSANEAIEKTEETVKFLSDRFAFCENTIEQLSKNLEAIAERVKESEEERAAVEKLKAAMITEVEMLYDVFMHSSLPQYSKDNVGEKVAAMKKALSAGEENG